MESVSPSPAPAPRTGRILAGRPRGGLTAAVQPRADQTHAGQSRAALTAAAQPAGGGARRQLLRLVTVSAVLAGLLGVSACQLDSRPDPAETATDLAQAITEQDFTGLPLTDAGRTTAAELPEALTPLAGASAQVMVRLVAVDDADRDRARAELEVSWDLTELGAPEATWTYPTTAGLAWNEDHQAWELDLEPDDVVAGLEPGGRVAVEETSPERGRILDGAGDPLMIERDVVRLGLDKARVEPEEVESSARALAEIAEIDPDAFVARAAGAGEQAFVEAITLRADGSVTLPTSAVQQVPGGRMIEDTAVLALPGPSRAACWAPTVSPPPNRWRPRKAGSPPVSRRASPGCRPPGTTT